MKFKTLKGGSAGGHNLGPGKRQMRTGGSSIRPTRSTSPWSRYPSGRDPSRDCFCAGEFPEQCVCSAVCINAGSPCNAGGMEPCNDMLCNGDTPPDPPEPDCFVAGTKVTMADGTEKNIEEIEVGDVVKSWNEETGEIRDSKVVKLIQPMHDDMLVIRFSNGAVNENTFDHPYYVKDKGWCSHSPTLTKERYDIDSELFEVGDICYHNNDEELEEVEVISIKENWGEVQTYIFELDTDNTFFANGVLVHNKTGGNGSGGQGEEPEVIEEPGCEGPRCDE